MAFGKWTAWLAALGMATTPAIPVQMARAAQSDPVPSADDICAPHLEMREYGDDTANIVVTGAVLRSPEMAPPSPSPPPPPPPPPATGVQAPPAPVVVTAQRIARVQAENRERYDGAPVSGIERVAETPVSTFSVDVDTGSYANVRRMIGEGRLPPSAAVRTEEMLNYFRYDYPRPQTDAVPFTVSADVAHTPWNGDTRILRIGLAGYDLPQAERPAANLVFLVDTSGSMQSMDKLPLVKCALALTAERLAPDDRVSIVTYAGSTRVALEPTSDKRKVIDAIGELTARGSTAGGAAIELAYDQARKNFRKGQVNRILLSTDGDFNVGITDRDSLIDMVEREREAGISLTTLGFGTGNYNEAMMEQIADHGNGNYFYIDGPAEAAKVLDDELASTLFTIAKDVKIQVEFNPAYVAEYRLLGYENRALEEEDFSNDEVDAGEIGAGHQVTALYEVVPVGAKGWLPERRYAANQRSEAAGAHSGEMAQIRLRYKLPDGEQSSLVEQIVFAAAMQNAATADGDMAFAIAVAGYGQKLRGDTHLNGWRFADSADLAKNGADGPLRDQFRALAAKAETLEPKAP